MPQPDFTNVTATELNLNPKYMRLWLNWLDHLRAEVDDIPPRNEEKQEKAIKKLWSETKKFIEVLNNAREQAMQNQTSLLYSLKHLKVFHAVIMGSMSHQILYGYCSLSRMFDLQGMDEEDKQMAERIVKFICGELKTDDGEPLLHPPIAERVSGRGMSTAWKMKPDFTENFMSLSMFAVNPLEEEEGGDEE